MSSDDNDLYADRSSTDNARTDDFDVAVVGAGVAGLRAARTLGETGVEPLVLEKSRGLGGRAATRRLHGAVADHGAQYFTVRDPRFQQQVDVWERAGALQVWARGFHALTPKGLEVPREGHPRYAFADGMNTFGKLLGEGIRVTRSAKVVGLTRVAQGWELGLEDGTVRRARRVLLNLPAPQALELAGSLLSTGLRNALEEVTFAPCLALMAGFAHAPPAWRGVVVEDEANPLSWLACDSSKRRAPGETVLVLHGNPAFSQDFLETPEAAVPQMLEVAATLGFSEPTWTALQRWRYAKVTQPHDAPYLQDDTLFFCGDWCGGAKLEAAYLSGLEVAEAMLKASAEQLTSPE